MSVMECKHRSFSAVYRRSVSTHRKGREPGCVNAAALYKLVKGVGWGRGAVLFLNVFNMFMTELFYFPSHTRPQVKPQGSNDVGRNISLVPNQQKPANLHQLLCSSRAALTFISDRGAPEL